MSEVKRYQWVGVRGLAEQDNGRWVKHEDYAALKQRAEAAEAAFSDNEEAKQLLFVQRDTLISANLTVGKALKAAEAKLAELAKQEPVAMRYRWAPPHMKMPDGSQFYGDWKLVADAEIANPGKDYERINLYARPAPAADLAELVPEEMNPKQASRSYGGEVVGYRDGWNACRAEMLRLIEEAKK